MTDPHSMSDSELCMAISLKREPKPIFSYSMLMIDNRTISNGGAWESGSLCGVTTIDPINWLLWENAGRLLEEMAEPFEIRLTRAYYAESYYCDLFALEGIAEDKLVLKCEVSQSPTLTRAICEAWIMVNE